MYRSRLSSALAMAALAAILVPSTLTGQTTFQRTYGGTHYDEGGSVQQTTDGGYVVVGYTGSFGAGGEDVFLIKTDAAGDTQWTRTFGGTTWDLGRSVQQTMDGGYIVAGYTTSFGAGGYDVYLIKTDANGDTLWTRTFGGASEDVGQSIQQTSDSCYIIASTTYSFGAGRCDAYLIKTDAAGDTLWTRTYGDTSDNAGYSVRQTADGGFIVAGLTESATARVYDVWLIRTDASGDTLWTKTFGGTGSERGNSVQQTTDGGYVIAGYTASFGAGEEDVYLIKTDANGDTLWTRTFGGPGFERGNSVQQTNDGGYIVTGYTTSFGAGDYDVYLIKTDADGGTLWTTTLGDTDWDQGNSVQQTTDGGYIVAAYTTPLSGGGRDVYLIKTDSLGTLAVAESKASPARAPALSLTCTPNPASGSVTISLSPSIPLSLSPVLRIYDAGGRLVLSQPVRTSPFPLSTSALPSGAYFLRCDVAGQHATTCLVVHR